MRFTWRKKRPEKGLAGIASGSNVGAILRCGRQDVASVGVARLMGEAVPRAYFWVASTDRIPWKNSAAEGRYFPCTEEGLEAAKAECLAYVKAQLEKA